MVLWICLGLVVLGLIGLGVLAYDVHSHLSRFQRALAAAQGDAQPRVVLLQQFVTAARAEVTAQRDRD